MREIVMDTETTGLDPASGDRVVEIGCIELINHIPSGRNWHRYLNPERDMPAAAFEVHGLSAEFLSGHPLFAEVVDDFLAFIADAPLVIHNAGFDIGFINAELALAGRPPVAMDRVIDTLALARRKHPGAANSLDALCKRYAIDNTHRTNHGALLDSELLAAVYVELIGGHQAALELAARHGGTAAGAGDGTPQRAQPLPPRLTAAEIEAHRAFVAKLGRSALWVAWLKEEDAA